MRLEKSHLVHFWVIANEKLFIYSYGEIMGMVFGIKMHLQNKIFEKLQICDFNIIFLVRNACNVIILEPWFLESPYTLIGMITFKKRDRFLKIFFLNNMVFWNHMFFFRINLNRFGMITFNKRSLSRKKLIFWAMFFGITVYICRDDHFQKMRSLPQKTVFLIYNWGFLGILFFRININICCDHRFQKKIIFFFEKKRFFCDHHFGESCFCCIHL